MKILRILQKDGGLSVTEVAERVGISQSPCSRRIANLQADGFIRGKRTELDRKKLGFDMMLIVRIKLVAHDPGVLISFKKAVAAIPEIQIALLVLGDFDFYLRVVVRDIEHYQHLLQEQLAALPGVREMQSSVILEAVKDGSSLPI